MEINGDCEVAFLSIFMKQQITFFSPTVGSSASLFLSVPKPDIFDESPNTQIDLLMWFSNIIPTVPYTFNTGHPEGSVHFYSSPII